MSKEVITSDEMKKTTVAFGLGSGLVPVDLEGAFRCARYVAASGLAPKGMERPESILIAAAMGAELGLSFMQSLQSIAVVNGRPSVYGDAVLALCRNTGQLTKFNETLEGDGLLMVATCEAMRTINGVVYSAKETFSVKDAQVAGLWTKPGPWLQYPRRMLKMRARGFALRDLFADILKGFKTTEEVMDIDDRQPTPIDTAFSSAPKAAQVQPGMVVDADFEVDGELVGGELVYDSGPKEEQSRAYKPRQDEEPGKKRSRRNATASGNTAGLTEETYNQLTAILATFDVSAQVAAYYKQVGLIPTQYDISYLREDEGVALLGQLRADYQCHGATEKKDGPAARPDEAAPAATNGTINSSLPGFEPSQEPEGTAGNPGYFGCPDLDHKLVAIDHCESACPELCDVYYKEKKAAAMQKANRMLGGR